MNALDQKVLLELSDGRFHSGEHLASVFGVTRAAVWKSVSSIKQLGLDIYSVRGKGYRIPGGIDLLDDQQLFKQLQSTHKNIQSLAQIQVFTSIASTNQYLLSNESTQLPHICLAEYQSVGRGRLGRQWHSPLAKNIYLSIRLQLPLIAAQLSGLSLVVGCAIADTLQDYGLQSVQLKWPNDIRIASRKAGGVLVEIAKSTDNYTELVVGVGLNWEMSENSNIGQDWANLRPLLMRGVTRTQLAGGVISSILNSIAEFEALGFESFEDRYAKYDELYQVQVNILQGNQLQTGIAAGVDARGALKVVIDGETKHFIGGEVSVRKTL